MANQLLKLADVTYTPGRPYQPAVPAYCYQQAVYSPGHWEYPGTSVTVQDQNTGQYVTFYSYTSVWVNGRTTYKTVCLPGTPEVPGIPASTSYAAIVGWNAGGRSIDPLSGNGYFEFKVGDSPVGAVVGFALENITTLPNEPTHAFYVHGAVVEVMESGTTVATSTTPHSSTTPMRIARAGTTVTYTHGSWMYTSSEPSYGSPYLDASLYYTADNVFDPITGVVVSVTGDAAGMLQPLDGLASNFDYGVDGGYAQGGGRLAALTGSATGEYTAVHSASGTLQPLDGLASNAPYAQGGGRLAALTGSADGGFPTPEFVYGYGVFSSMSGSSLLNVGQYGDAEGTLQPMSGLAANYPANYGQAEGTLQPLAGASAYLTTPENDLPRLTQGLIAADYYFTRYVDRATIRDTLSLSGDVSANFFVEDAIIDALVLQDSLTVQQAIAALIRSGLLVTGDSAAAQRAAVQYAVNVLTGALTTYNGFEFTGYAQAGGSVYGVKSDGVYVIRQGDDDGSPISIDIDFGASTYGSPTAKTLEAAYLGVATDGQVYLRANNDGTERVYRVVQRGPIMRALMAKGVTGRRWSLSLEVVDATEFELDLVEIMVGINTRRWTR